MANQALLIERLTHQIHELPANSLRELLHYAEFLRHKAKRKKTKTKELNTLTIIKLEGILEGYDVSPEMLVETRRELWKGFGEREL